MELYHYGVKGMKWGVRRYRNEDGSLTPAGRKRLAKGIRKNTDFINHPTQDRGRMVSGKHTTYYQKRIAEMSEIQQLHNKLSSSRKELHDKLEFARKFTFDDDLVEKYQEKAARKHCKDFNITDPDEIEYVIEMFKYEDFDQGSTGSFALYCKDNKVDYHKYSSDVYKAEKDYEQTCREYVNEMLKEYGSKKVGTGFHGNKETVADVATRALVQINDNERARKGMYIPG